MAQTATAVNACDVVIQLDNAGGSLTDISGSTNQVALGFQNAILTYWRADQDVPTRREMTRDMGVTMTVLYSTADSEALALLRDWATAEITGADARTLRVDVPDSTSGSDRYEVEVLPASLDFSLGSGEGGPVMVSANLETTGEYSVSEI